MCSTDWSRRSKAQEGQRAPPDTGVTNKRIMLSSNSGTACKKLTAHTGEVYESFFLFFLSFFFLVFSFGFVSFIFSRLFSFFFMILFSLSFYFFKWDEVLFLHDSRRSCFNERRAATPWQTDTSKHVWRFPELVDTMQYVLRVEQRRNVPVHVLRATVEHERNDQDVFRTSEWPLLLPRLAWQWTEVVLCR